MVISVGEILADMIGTTAGGRVSYERYAGGAPFNVACGVKRLGGSAGFVGRVGDDLIGKFLLSCAGEQGFDYLDLRPDSRHNTTLAFVEIDETGERSFMFYRKQTADYRFSDESLPLPPAHIVHLGSLMLSEAEGRDFAARLIGAVRGKSLLSFDVNYRDDLFASAAEAMAAYRPCIEAADIVKFSEDELTLFTGQNDLAAAAKAVAGRDKLVCVTLGGKGSAYCFGGQFRAVPTIKVKPVDTTGAGDAFYAAALTRLDAEDFAALTPKKLDAIFRYANVCGALTTTARGAIDALPTPDAIAARLEEL